MAAKEKRWLVVADDGRHVTLGRNSDPSEEDIRAATRALVGQGLGGWLAVSEGSYYCHGPLALLLVRELTACRLSWDEALELFQANRRDALRDMAKK